MYVPNEASSAEEPCNRNVITVLLDDAVGYFHVISVVQRNSGNFEVLKVDRADSDVNVLVAVDAWVWSKGENAGA